VKGFQAIVFAGGGCRCFWQAGFWSEAAPVLGVRAQVVTGVSAGAAFACAAFSDALERVLEEFVARVAANERNVYPRNALSGGRVFPHERIYRETILATLDAEALARLHEGPEIRVLVGRPPTWAGARTGVALGAAAFLAEQTRRTVHASWGRRLGFRAEFASVRSCRTPAELAELILASSCTPPLTGFYRRAGAPVLDGGVYDNAPVEAAAPAERMLVLLSRHHPEASLPRVPGRTYVQPSEPIPVAKWDYTNPEAVHATYDLGRADGERFVRELDGIAA